MAHLKRIASPKSWIIPKKGTKYVLKAYPGKMNDISMPVGMLVRDLLKLTAIKKETRAFLKGKELMIDGKTIEEEKFPVSLFDTIALPKMKKFYRVLINDKGKFEMQEIKESEINHKVYKVLNRRSISGGKTQLNLFNGRNILTEGKINVNDSVLVDLKNNSVIKHLVLRKGAKTYILGGKHLGAFGIIEQIGEKNVGVKIGSEVFEIPLDKIYVLD